MRRRPEHFYLLPALARKFSCDKSDVIVAVDILRRSGYDIRADKNGAYAFFAAPDKLLASELTYRLRTSFVGKKVYAYKSVQSTNSIACQLAEVGAPEGTIVIAESQSRGRGRLGRQWFSAPELGAYVSIILYPKIDAAAAPGLSLMTGVALAEVIASLDTMAVHIKWPNDCLINGRKTAGILTEVATEGGKVKYAVIGIGININHRRRDFPQDVSSGATSLRAEMKEPLRRVEFLQKFLGAFEKEYNRFRKQGLKASHKRLIRFSNLIGRAVALDARKRTITGTAVDIDPNGNLVVDTPDGLESFAAGEVTIVKR